MQATITKLSLFAQGYRIRAGKSAGELLIRKADGTRYTITPERNCCTCPAGQFGRPCKHLREARDLVIEQWAEINDNPRHEQQMYLLMLRWEEICAAVKAARK